MSSGKVEPHIIFSSDNFFSLTDLLTQFLQWDCKLYSIRIYRYPTKDNHYDVVISICVRKTEVHNFGESFSTCESSEDIIPFYFKYWLLSWSQKEKTLLCSHLNVYCFCVTSEFFEHLSNSSYMFAQINLIMYLFFSAL